MANVNCTKCGRSFDLNLVKGPIDSKYKPVCFRCNPFQSADLNRGQGNVSKTWPMCKCGMPTVPGMQTCGSLACVGFIQQP